MSSPILVPVRRRRTLRLSRALALLLALLALALARRSGGVAHYTPYHCNVRKMTSAAKHRCGKERHTVEEGTKKYIRVICWHCRLLNLESRSSSHPAQAPYRMVEFFTKLPTNSFFLLLSQGPTSFRLFSFRKSFEGADRSGLLLARSRHITGAVASFKKSCESSHQPALYLFLTDHCMKSVHFHSRVGKAPRKNIRRERANSISATGQSDL